MAMPSQDDQSTTVVLMEMGPGHLYVKIVGRRPDPARADLLLRKTIDAWLSARSHLVLDRIEPVIEAGEIRGLHAYYHPLENSLPPSSPSPQAPTKDSAPWTISVSNEILGQLPREHVEAIVDEAMSVWQQNEAGQGSLLVVNARRIAVLLDRGARRGEVIPVAEMTDVLNGPTRQALLSWLESPQTRLFVTQIRDRGVARRDDLAAQSRIVEPAYVRTNMTYDPARKPRT